MPYEPPDSTALNDRPRDPPLQPTTDGLVTIRPPRSGDAEVLIAGRDEAFHRWLGPGADAPAPTGCIEVRGAVVGWVDYDVDRAWLQPGEVNVGYNVFAAHRGCGYASRAVQLLLHHLAVATAWRTATLLIHPENRRSLALAERLRFNACGDLDGNPYFKRPVPPLTYSDGVVTIRRQRIEDVEADLDAKDDAQIDWLWLPGQRQTWEAMTPAEQRAHALRRLAGNRAAWARGPQWTFAVDTQDADCVAYVDCDLINVHVPTGEANVSYWSHPAHRGRGYASRAVRLLLAFLKDHTGARTAHLVVDEQNAASRRVADAIGAVERERWQNAQGRTMIRYLRAV
jgi:RimJ/RimL family protein N-acetyltransferase